MPEELKKTNEEILDEVDANLQGVTEKKEEVTEIEEQTPQLSDEEQRAFDHGWRPKDQFEGEPEDWVSAKEFNKRASLFARIAKYGAENREMRESLKKLFDHNRRLFDAGYKKAMDDLKDQRISAIEDGDTRKLVQVEEQIDNLKSEHANAIREFDSSLVDTRRTGPTPEQQILFENWVDSNPWYNKNAELTRIADNYAKELVEKARESGRQVEYGKLLNEVSREIRANNPEYFNTTREQRSSNVDSGARGSRKPGNSGTRYSLNSIPEEERAIARTIMQSTGLTEQQYVKQYMEAKRG